MGIHKKSAALLLCLILLCPACAKKTEPEPPKVVSHYYPKCYEPLAYLEHRSTRAGSGIALGAAQGGIITGISAVIIGAITGTLKSINVLAGAAAGVAAGAGVAAVREASGDNKEDTSRMATYLAQIDGDIANIHDVTGAAATYSLQCYRKAFTSLKEEIEKGQLGRAEAEKHFTEIVAGTEEAAKVLDQPTDTLAMQKEFDSALERSQAR